jgi:hypothetical protein
MLLKLRISFSVTWLRVGVSEPSFWELHVLSSNFEEIKLLKTMNEHKKRAEGKLVPSPELVIQVKRRLNIG